MKNACDDYTYKTEVLKITHRVLIFNTFCIAFHTISVLEHLTHVVC